MSNNMKDALTVAEVTVAETETINAATLEVFNTMDALSVDELEAIERLVSLRMKPLEVSALEAEYPKANLVQLFFIYKMKQLAADEIVAYAWRKNQKDWKDSVLVSTRNILKENVNIRKNAEHELVELNDSIPYVHHAAIIKYVVDALDKGSQDERILQMQKIFKS